MKPHLAEANRRRSVESDRTFAMLSALADTEVTNADAHADATGVAAVTWLECERLILGEDIREARRAGHTTTPAYAAMMVRQRALEIACATLEIVEPR